jgi:uncharacterized protein YndB with AHSA1/START domain
MTSSSEIRWPPELDPGRAPVHVRNEMVTTAPPEVVWSWLVRAAGWPTWYPNSHAVRIEGGAQDLAEGSLFRWRTFGVSLVSRVEEFVPAERIAWTARGLGVRAYHAWLVRPLPAGSHVLTEETQHGWLARLGSKLMPNRMSQGHQVWLESLRRKAEAGPPERDAHPRAPHRPPRRGRGGRHSRRAHHDAQRRLREAQLRVELLRRAQRPLTVEQRHDPVTHVEDD